MIRVEKKWIAFLLGVSIIILLIPACIGITPQSDQTAQVVYPTVVITQYVTQIVATPIATLPPPPTAIAQQQNKNVIVGFDPFAVDIYYPLQGCVASRLRVGDRAFVAYGGDTMKLFPTLDIGFAPPTRNLVNGEYVDIVSGPYCDRGAVVWGVVTEGDELAGFIPEGDGNTYWLLPLGEQINYKALLKKERMKSSITISILGFGGYCGAR